MDDDGDGSLALPIPLPLAPSTSALPSPRSSPLSALQMVDVDRRMPMRPDLPPPCRRSPFLSRSVPAHCRPAAPARAVARFTHRLPGPPAGQCSCRIASRFRAAVGDGARCLSLRCPDPSCSVAGGTNNKTLAYQIWHELTHSS
uniref:Uncharacterized protein n=1 Tax=Oryza meridionalis TaxID=40149 RepID=A0A0E0EEH6_9ORYZ